MAWYPSLYAPHAGGAYDSHHRTAELLVALGGAAATWPLAVRAQQGVLPVVGWLNSETPEGGYGLLAVAFRQGLSESGFVEGRNGSLSLPMPSSSAGASKSSRSPPATRCPQLHHGARPPQPAA